MDRSLSRAAAWRPSGLVATGSTRATSAFGGTYSIKSVLPTVAPDLSYDDLETGDGAVAAREYVRMV